MDLMILVAMKFTYCRYSFHLLLKSTLNIVPGHCDEKYNVILYPIFLFYRSNITNKTDINLLKGMTKTYMV